MAMQGNTHDEAVRASEEGKAQLTLEKVLPAVLLKIMCEEAMIREPVITMTETESPGHSPEDAQSKTHTVCLTCHDKQLTVNFPATLSKNTCKNYAQHFLLKAFYTEYELPEIAEPYAKYETVHVPRAKSQADVISHRNTKMDGMNRAIETLQRETSLSAEEKELRLFFVQKRKILWTEAGSTVKLPPFESFMTGLKQRKPHLFWSDAEKEERKRSNWSNPNMQLDRACVEFSLKVVYDMKKTVAPEGTNIAVGSITVFKKSCDGGKSLTEFFRVEHTTERVQPDFPGLLARARLGEFNVGYLDRFDHWKKWKKEICELAVKQLVELWIMAEPDSAFKLQEQRELEKITRKAENEAIQARNREAKIAKKAQTQARIATEKAAKIARQEAKAVAFEARRAKEREAAAERKRLKLEATQKRLEERKVEAAAQKEAKNLAKQEAAQKRLEERQLEAAVLRAQKMGKDDRRKEDLGGDRRRFEVKREVRKSPGRRESWRSTTDGRDNRGRSLYDDNLRMASQADRRRERRSLSDDARRRRSRSPLRGRHDGYAKRY